MTRMIVIDATVLEEQKEWFELGNPAAVDPVLTYFDMTKAEVAVAYAEFIQKPVLGFPLYRLEHLQCSIHDGRLDDSQFAGLMELHENIQGNISFVLKGRNTDSLDHKLGKGQGPVFLDGSQDGLSQIHRMLDIEMKEWSYLQWPSSPHWASVQNKLLAGATAVVILGVTDEPSPKLKGLLRWVHLDYGVAEAAKVVVDQQSPNEDRDAAIIHEDDHAKNGELLLTITSDEFRLMAQAVGFYRSWRLSHADPLTNAQIGLKPAATTAIIRNLQSKLEDTVLGQSVAGGDKERTMELRLMPA